jgi:hypothetical protein
VQCWLLFLSFPFVSFCNVSSSLCLIWFFGYFLEFKFGPSLAWCPMFCMWDFFYLFRPSSLSKALSSFWSLSLGWWGGALNSPLGTLPSLVNLGLGIKLKPFCTFHLGLFQPCLNSCILRALRCEVHIIFCFPLYC